MGGKDLYIAYRNPDKAGEGRKNWAPPLIPPAMRCFLWCENGTLYYASNGLPGLGGLDIFYATKKGDIWVDPVNMKSPINSSSDDFGMLIEKTKPKNQNDLVR